MRHNINFTQTLVAYSCIVLKSIFMLWLRLDHYSLNVRPGNWRSRLELSYNFRQRLMELFQVISSNINILFLWSKDDILIFTDRTGLYIAHIIHLLAIITTLLSDHHLFIVNLLELGYAEFIAILFGPQRCMFRSCHKNNITVLVLLIK